MLDNKLITFLTLLEEKNYTKTADRLKFTQPSVSNHIKMLEQEFNIELFTNPKTFELTKQGQLLYEYAKSAKAEYELLEHTINRPESDLISIGITNTAFRSINNKLMFDYVEGSPLYNILICEYDIVLDLLDKGEIQYAIVDRSFDSSRYSSNYLTRSNLILVCKPNGKYANHERITREQLSNAILVTASDSSGMYTIASNSLSDKNLRLKKNIRVTSNSIDGMYRLINIYDAIGFMYEEAAKQYIEQGLLNRIELLKFNPTQNIYAIYKNTTEYDVANDEIIKKITKGEEQND